MLRFVVRRILLMIPVLLGLIVLLFIWVRALPGDPARALLGEKATPESIASVNAQYGFDQPLLQQYLIYASQLLQGNFGNSPRTGEPVLETFIERFPATLELAIAALIFAIVVGIPLGYWAATHAGGWLDTFAVGTSLAGVVIPVFVLAYMLKLVFAVGLPGALGVLAVLPSSGRQDPRIDATHITNFYVLDGLLTREWDASWDAIVHLILPAIALGSIPLAIIVRMTRASVVDVLNEDYVRTANAKGLSQGRDHPPARAPQRAAAGDHRDRPADRCAAGRRGADRVGVRDQRHRLLPVRGDQQPGLRRAAGVHPVHRRHLRRGEPDGRPGVRRHRSPTQDEVITP